MAKELRAGKEIREGGFVKGFNAIQKSHKPIVRKELCTLLYWGNFKFTSLLYGKRQFRIWETEQITKYFADKGINAWTGELINK
jgi:hypothetical protein